MRLLIIELHGMDISCVKTMPFLMRLRQPKEFVTYTGHSSSTALWTGIDELQNESYHKHFWDGSYSFWDHNIFRILRGDLYFSKNGQRKFRLSRTKHYFQDCSIFDELDYCYSERPIIATNKGLYFDLAKNEIKRVKKFQKYWNKTLNFIRLRKIDILGHKYGPDNIEVRKHSELLDDLLKNIYDEFDGEIITFSLYGMLKPKKKINVIPYLNEIKDLIFFVDDENIRIWNNNRKYSIEKAINYIDSLKCGYWLQDKPDRKFGDYFYKADEGIAFVPNNYVKHDIKGIHSSKGWMVSNCGTINHITEFKDLILKICKG